MAYAGLPCCSCSTEWLPTFVAELKRSGIEVRFTQLNGSYGPSAGTHAGGAFDLVVVKRGLRTLAAAYKLVVKIARQMGADATWVRPYNWDNRRGILHVHGLLTGCPHLSWQAKSQQTDVRNNRNGLANRGADTGPRPLSGRTWRQGIAWAKARQTPKFHKKSASYIVVDAPAWGRKSYGLPGTKLSPARPAGWTFKADGWSVFDGVLYVREAKTGHWYHGPSLDLLKAAPKPKAYRVRMATWNIADKMPNQGSRARSIAAWVKRSKLDLLAVQEATGTVDGKASDYSRAVRAELDGAEPGKWAAAIPTLPFNENYLYYSRLRFVLTKRLDDLVLRVAGAGGRHCSRALLTERATSRRLLAANMHLVDGKGLDRQRQEQAAIALRQLVKDADEHDADLVVFGDRNTVATLTALKAAGLSDALGRAKTKRNADRQTFRSGKTTGTPARGGQIDFVAVPTSWVVNSAEVAVDAAGSDHVPLVIDTTTA